MPIMDDYQKLLGEIASLKRQVAGMFRPATVKSVGGKDGKQGDQLRAVLGKDKDGKDILGPWINTSNHRGGSRERRSFAEGGEGEGQNVMLLCPGGDVSQAVVLPYAPNQKNQAPDHANQDGKGEETYQQGHTRSRTKDGGNAWWFQAPQQQQQSGGQQPGHMMGQGEQTEGTREPQSADADDMAMALNKGKSFTARYKKESRLMVSSKGAMMAIGEGSPTHYALIDKEKKMLLVSHPWEIGAPIEVDDSLAG